MQGVCEDCGGGPARISLSGVELCDRCADRRIAELTGWPELPDPPPSDELTGPDGRRHVMRYRLMRMPTGILATAEEDCLPDKPGYELDVLGPHDADPARVVAALRSRIAREDGTLYLEPDPRGGWLVSGTELRGRVEEDHSDEDGWLETPRVVVDGRALSWEELGRAVNPFVGWELRMTFGGKEMDEEEAPLAEVVPLEWTRAEQFDEGDLDDLDDLDDDALISALEAQDAAAVELIREARRRRTPTTGSGARPVSDGSGSPRRRTRSCSWIPWQRRSRPVRRPAWGPNRNR